MSIPATAFGRALDQLGREIVSGDLPSGHADTIDGLVERTGASRSVVREVTRVLGSVGMLSAGRRVGLRILPREHWDTLNVHVIRWRLDGPDVHEQIAELRALRLAVEPAAAAAAAAANTAAAASAAGEGRPTTRVGPLADLQAAARAMQVAAEDPDPTAFLRADRALHSAVLALSANSMFTRLRAVIEEGLRDRALRERAGLTPDPYDLALHLEVARAITAGEGPAAAAAMREIVERTSPGDG
ncbi:MAG: FadR/GntR family transcriptional regulator [Brachybacterium sp.]|uniref:FadR/GntR family transcriptional regulator n=1 Tax=Brachybacterium sp. AOP42-E1-35 TaxID=3457664 RepID=UPI003FB8754D